MASPIRKKNTSVIDRLVSQPHQFTFYQAVRLLIAAGGAQTLGRSGTEIGTSRNAAQEPIRFRSTPALEFPPAEIVSLNPVNRQSKESRVSDDAGNRPIDMEVAFWGLIGPVGALPNHYTQLMIDRVHHKDLALKDFFDLFSHRQLSLFYRAWEKHFVSVGFERGLREDNPAADLLRHSLLSLVGRGTKRVRNRLEILDDVNVYYGGLFVDRPNAQSLQQMLVDFLGIPATVLSLFGQWLSLPASECSRLGMLGGHCQLGIDTVLGDRVWDATSKFRVRLGPVTYSQFKAMMPTGFQLAPLCQLIRSYVGCEFSFDIQMELLAEEIPMCQLTSPVSDEAVDSKATSGTFANLGWNSWLCSSTPSDNSTDAVFQHDGFPLDHSPQ
jgi:type VI secretion system protein ImpH